MGFIIVRTVAIASAQTVLKNIKVRIIIFIADVAVAIALIVTRWRDGVGHGSKSQGCEEDFGVHIGGKLEAKMLR